MMKMMNKLIMRVSLTVVAMAMIGSGASAVQGTAKAVMKVITAVQIAPTSNLIFSDATPGSAAEVVLAGATDNSKTASFTISGEPSRPIAVTIPADNTVIMKKGTGGTAQKEIAVNDFTSNDPTAISTSGSVVLVIGATREALNANQEVGNYEADFIVDVVYL